jgi:hypothetical protein
MIWLSALRVDRHDPPLRRIVEARIEHEELLRVLDPQGVIIEQDFDGLGPESAIHIQTEVVEPDLPILAYLARQLAEPKNPAEADGGDDAPCGLPQNHLGGQIVDIQP